MSLFYVKNLVQLANKENIENCNKAQISCSLKNNELQCSNGAKWIVDSTSSASGSTDELISPSSPCLWPQIRAAFLSSWISMASGASLGFATPAIPLLFHESSSLVTTKEDLSWMASIITIGAFMGGVCSGPCVAIGRRSTLWIGAVPLLLAWILLANANQVWILLFTHIVFGFCMGVVTDANQLYISETTHPERRGALGCMPVLMFNLGMLACYVAALFLKSWENIAWFGALLTLPALFLPYFVPESPSFLASQNREAEALIALHKLRGGAWDSASELAELLSCEKPQQGIKARVTALKEASAWRPCILVIAIRLFSRFCGLRAIQAYTNIILASSRSSLESGIGTVIIGSVQWIFTLVACGLVDRLGRRFLLISSQGIMALALFILAIYLYLEPGVEAHPTLGWLPVTCIAFYVIANALGLGPISGLVLGELVPQRHRSIASSITGGLSWFAAFIVTLSFSGLQDLLMLHGALAVYASCCVCGLLVVAKFVPETRGMSQLAIEDLFNSKQKNKSKIKQDAENPNTENKQTINKFVTC